jgi:hypothetical protein
MNNIRVFAVYDSTEGWKQKSTNIHFISIDGTTSEEKTKAILRQYIDAINEYRAIQIKQYSKPVNSLEHFGMEPKLDIVNISRCLELTSFLGSREAILNLVKNNIIIAGYEPIELALAVIHSIKEPIFEGYKQQLISTLDDICEEEY